MGELLRSADVAILATAEALLGEASIPVHIADRNAAIIGGSLSVVQPRVLVPDDCEDEAREVLSDAGMGDLLRPAR